MNNNIKQETRYRLLKVISQDANFTQREMAGKMGISLGMVNYCLAELTKKGFVKINRFKDSQSKLQYLYQLTPQGLEAKAGLTLSFLKWKMAEYNEIKCQIRELAGEADNAGLEQLPDYEILDEIIR